MFEEDRVVLEEVWKSLFQSRLIVGFMVLWDSSA